MNIRLMGPEAEIGPVVEALKKTLTVISVSKPHPNHGGDKQVRVFVEAEAPEEVVP